MAGPWWSARSTGTAGSPPTSSGHEPLPAAAVASDRRRSSPRGSPRPISVRASRAVSHGDQPSDSIPGRHPPGGRRQLLPDQVQCRSDGRRLGVDRPQRRPDEDPHDPRRRQPAPARRGSRSPFWSLLALPPDADQGPVRRRLPSPPFWRRSSGRRRRRGRGRSARRRRRPRAGPRLRAGGRPGRGRRRTTSRRGRSGPPAEDRRLGAGGQQAGSLGVLAVLADPAPALDGVARLGHGSDQLGVGGRAEGDEGLAGRRPVPVASGIRPDRRWPAARPARKPCSSRRPELVAGLGQPGGGGQVGRRRGPAGSPGRLRPRR